MTDYEPGSKVTITTPAAVYTGTVDLDGEYLIIELMADDDVTFDISYDVLGDGTLYVDQGSHDVDNTSRKFPYFGKGKTRIFATKNDDNVVSTDVYCKISTDDTDGFTGYCEPEDIRDYSNLESKEYSNSQLYGMIHQVSRDIDRKTGRIWGRTLTETDEYYDGNGTDELLLDKKDISSITSLSIDENGDGTWTSITTSTVKIVGDEGRIFLTDDSELDMFANDDTIKGVKITYVYGNSDIPAGIKRLCVLMVLSLMFEDDTKQNEIDDLIKKFRSDTITLV